MTKKGRGSSFRRVQERETHESEDTVNSVWKETIGRKVNQYKHRMKDISNKLGWFNQTGTDIARIITQFETSRDRLKEIKLIILYRK